MRYYMHNKYLSYVCYSLVFFVSSVECEGKRMREKEEMINQMHLILGTDCLIIN